MTSTTSLAEPGQQVRQPTSPTGQPVAPSSWLVGPWFDLLFIANVYWPLLLVFTTLGGEEFHQGALFWQVYFVTAPHRWITLVLVAVDRQRTAGREWTFLLVGGGIVAACLLLRLSTNSLLCLGAIDYVWNAWHFASQHHGIYRISERRRGNVRSSQGVASVEKVVFRGFLLYVIARVAGVGWQGSSTQWGGIWSSLDLAVCAIPLMLLARMITSSLRSGCWVAGNTYLVSVMTLFASMLCAAHFEQRQTVIVLAMVSAVFHAVEYLAVVTWASTETSRRSRADLMGHMARRWVMFLAFFVLFMGLTNYAFAVGYEQTWILVNLIVAFLHYAYDGMIWKSGRRPPVGGTRT